MKPKLVQAILFVALIAAAFALSQLRKGDRGAAPSAATDVIAGPRPAASRPADASKTTARPDLQRAERVGKPSSSDISRPSVSFRTRAQLLDHFDKHGREFGAKSVDEYLRLAQSLRDAPKGGSIVEVVRATDGVVTRFDRKSGAFLAFNRDGSIRTFFRPDDGEAYFRRQVDREGEAQP